MFCIRKLNHLFIQKIAKIVGGDVIDHCLSSNKMIPYGFAFDNEGFLYQLTPLCAKVYSKVELTVDGPSVTSKGKGIDRQILKKYNKEPELYKKVFDEKKQIRENVQRFKSNKSKMMTIKVNKMTLAAKNPKRNVLRKPDKNYNPNYPWEK